MALAQPEFRVPDLATSFQRDGWIAVPGLDPAKLDGLRGLWAEVEAEHSGLFASTTFKANSETLRRRISDGIMQSAKDMATGLVAGYRMVSAGFMVKRPGGDSVKLHRHEALLDEARHVALLVWVPLQDTPCESGCMVVVPGTHRSRSITGLEIPLFEEPPDARELPLRAGEALVMDHRLVHGSRPNRSGADRLAVSLLLAPAQAPLWHCRRSAGWLDIFEVPDDFFVRWLPGTPPALDRPPVFRFPLRKSE